MTIIIDFDNTIVDSSRAAVNYIRDKYKVMYENPEPFDHSKLLWDFKPFLIEDYQSKEAVKYLSEDSFFTTVTPLPGAVDKIKKLSKQHKLILCTNRTGESFDKVKDWLKRHDLYQYFTHVICVSSFDKSPIAGDVIIDDKYDCVRYGSRRTRILFGGYQYTRDDFIKGFNEDNDKESYMFCNSWEDVPVSFISPEDFL